MTFQELHSRPFLPLATERLLMRPISQEDAPEIARLLNNLNVSKTLARVPYPYSLQDAHHFISLKIQEMKEGQPVVVLTILDRTNHQFMGLISIENGTIGYWLGEPCWGKGFMKEAAKAFVHFLFDMCGIPEFEISAIPSNLGSVRIIEGLGCTPTEQKKVFTPALQETQLSQYYKLTQEDYWARYEALTVPILWVSAAALLKDGQLLVAERPQGKSMAGVWELPGGKIEEGETPERPLARELHEELGITVDPHNLKPLTFASYRYEKFHLVMPFFTLTQWEGELHSKENQRLAWIHYQDLIHYPTPAADIALFHKLYDVMQREGLWTAAAESEN